MAFSVVDCKWEHQEVAHEQVVDAFPFLQKYHKPESTQIDGTLGLRVNKAVKCPIFLIFTEMFFVFLRVAGKETSWSEG